MTHRTYSPLDSPKYSCDEMSPDGDHHTYCRDPRACEWEPTVVSLGEALPGVLAEMRRRAGLPEPGREG